MTEPKCSKRITNVQNFMDRIREITEFFNYSQTRKYAEIEKYVDLLRSKVWWIMMMMIMMNCYCAGMVDRRKAFSLISSRDHWTCAEPEFRLCRMKLCSSHNHYATAPRWASRVVGIETFLEFYEALLKTFEENYRN